MERNGLAMSVYHEVIEALLPLIQAFDRLGISYFDQLSKRHPAFIQSHKIKIQHTTS
jgi:hypothetical protein